MSLGSMTKDLTKRWIAPIIALTLAVGTTSCEKSPAPKFKPGDRVVTIMGAEGIVALRTRFSVDDVYYIRLAGPDPEAVLRRPYGPVASAGFHFSGPYYEADLRLVSK